MSQDLPVCVGLPAFHEPRFIERLAALPGVRPVILPIDPDAEWATVNPGQAMPEPPPWAESVADERRAALAEAEVLVALHVPQDLPQLAPNLRWVQGVGAGMEQFAEAGVRPDKILVTNASGVSAASMAEWVLGRLLQVWKRFRETDDFQRRHVFERSYGRTFAGSTIGIVGLGNIGREVAVRARALGCRVIATRRSAKAGAKSEFADELFTPEKLHEMLGLCDAVVLSTPSTPETRHLMDAEALAAMRNDAVLVNVARGAVVDEEALIEVIRSKQLGAAVLDVFDVEPLPETSPLWDFENAYVSAHSSVSVDRYMEDVFELFFENLQRFIAGDELRNVMDERGLGLG